MPVQTPQQPWNFFSRNRPNLIFFKKSGKFCHFSELEFSCKMTRFVNKLVKNNLDFKAWWLNNQTKKLTNFVIFISKMDHSAQFSGNVRYRVSFF